LGSPVLLNDAGQTAFWASLDRYQINSGFWSERSGSLALVARSGNPAPGTATHFDYLQSDFPNLSLRLNDDGKTAFRAHALRYGIWSEGSGSLSLVSDRFQSGPVSAPALNDLGRVAFATYLWIWSDRSGTAAPAVHIGSQVPGVASGVFFGHRIGTPGNEPFGTPAFNNDSQIAFRAFLKGAGIDYQNDDGVWSEGSGSLALVARTGSQAPGAPAGVTFAQVRQSAAQVTGDYPTAFGNPVLNDAGQVAFRAGLSGVGSEAGIWATDRAGVLQLVARSGIQAPGLPDGVNFGYLGDGRYNFGDLFPFSDPVLNDAGQIAFWARLTNGESIWATDRNGTLRLIARTGEPVEVVPGEFLRFEHLHLVGGTGNSDGRPSGFNNRGQVAFWAEFGDGFHEGVFVSNRVAVPEPQNVVLIGGGVVGILLCRRRS
jgi:hypothetical protein